MGIHTSGELLEQRTRKSENKRRGSDALTTATGSLTSGSTKAGFITSRVKRGMPRCASHVRPKIR